jgi:hypothetical protein
MTRQVPPDARKGKKRSKRRQPLERWLSQEIVDEPFLALAAVSSNFGCEHQGQTTTWKK